MKRVALLFMALVLLILVSSADAAQHIAGRYLRIAASVPPTTTIGLPVRFRSAVPRFSMMKLTAELELPARMLPNP